MKIGKFIYLLNVINFLFIQHYIVNFFYKYFTNYTLIPRLELIKKITYKLEKVNIVYIKIFQSFCLEKEILNNDERDYLMKYTDQVPYNNNDIDFSILEKLEKEYDILIENKTPINSGIIGVVFKGINKKDDNKKVVIKLLKNQIKEKYVEAFSEIETIISYLRNFPILKNLNLHLMLEDSKISILDQTDFTKETNNIKIFYEK